MSGRMEANMRFDKRSKNRLKNLPSCVTDYYINLQASGKEPRTCYDYVAAVDRALQKISGGNAKMYDVRKLNEEVLSQYMISTSRKLVNGEWKETSFANRQTIWSSLNSFCTYLYRKKILNENPMDMIDRPQNKDNVIRKVPSVDDIQELFRGFNRDINGYNAFETTERLRERGLLVRDRFVLMLLVHTGIRREAMAQIDYEDIDFEQQQLTVVDKRHKTLIYQLNKKVVGALQAWLSERMWLFPQYEATGPLFVNMDGTRLSDAAIHAIVKKYTQKYLGEAYSPHKFRAAYCSLLYEQTRDIEFVRDAVGHSNVSVTQRYIVKKEPAQKTAAQMLDDLF